MSASKPKKSLYHWRLIFVFSLLIILSIIGGWLWFKSHQFWQQQSALAAFYQLPIPLPDGQPGDLIRQQPINTPIPGGGQAWRILYRSQLQDGTPVVSSGLVIIPANYPTTGSPTLAWAHGTVGMADQCAPSRSTTPGANIGGLSEILSRGWLIAATDYYGLGTPGTEHYLIGPDEAQDVLNSVRAARQLAHNRNPDFVLWGLSQGGHAVLFAANLAPTYTPELHLVAAAAAAPATELPSLMSQQYQQVTSWVIGPEIALAWPLVYPQLPLSKVLTTTGYQNYQRLAEECTAPSTLEGLVRQKFQENFFAINPNSSPIWRQALTQEIPPFIQKTPVLIAQSLNDQVVLPNTTAKYAKASCFAGTNLTLDWLGDITHNQTALVAGPTVISWLDQQLQRIPAENTCQQTLPVTPAP